MFRVRSLLICCAILIAVGPRLVQADGWKTGAAKASITPQQSMSMAGYGSRNHPSTGFLNDLHAKALVLEVAGGKRAVVITLDLVGISPDVADPLLADLESKYQLPRAAVAICCSHTHSGPVVGKNLRSLHYDLLDEGQQKLIDAYAVELRAKIVELVGQAIGSLAPSELSYGHGRATFATNRRNNSEPDVPRLRAEGKLVGPFDHDVPVLKVTDSAGKLQAVLFGYACHATVLSEYDWSSDYPGFAQAEIEKAHPDCVALFFAGCGADQNPLPRRTPELARQYGTQLAAAVEEVLSKSLEPIAPRLAIAFETIPLELAQVPTREDIEKDARSGDKYVAARAKYFLAELAAGREIPATYAYPVEVWRLGEKLTFVALGGEVVVDYAVRLKSEIGPDDTWVAGYSNDVMAYIPSRRVLAEGGYEGGGAMVYYSLPSAWKPTIEEAIIKAVRGAEPTR
jgi:neutral ceramidase